VCGTCSTYGEIRNACNILVDNLQCYTVKFEVLRVMIMEVTVFWDMTPCTLVYIYYFKAPAASSFYPEKGGNRILKKRW
jgi:hypothetical protein